MPYAACVTTANVTDLNGTAKLFEEIDFSIPTLQTVLDDSGYTGENFANTIFQLTGANVEIAKRSELHTFVVTPKRWIVERSFAWLDKCRRLWKICEHYLFNSLSMVKLAFVSLLSKRLLTDSYKTVTYIPIAKAKGFTSLLIKL